MMEEIITALCELAIGIATMAVAYYVIPWLKEKRLLSIVKKAVEAAEKISENRELDKKEYVCRVLKRAGIQLGEAVDAMIEGCVLELDLQTGKKQDKQNNI